MAKKKRKAPVVGDEEIDAASIRTFCRRHGISVASYYNLPPEQRPREKIVGGRKLITKEAGAEWREREAAVAAATTA